MTDASAEPSPKQSLRAESQAVFLRVEETVDHCAKVSRVSCEIVDPGIETSNIRRAAQVTIVL